MVNIFIIPLKNNVFFYKFRINLSSVLYTLQFRYNGRMNRWIMDVSDAAGNQIVSGLPLLIKRNLAGQYVTLSLPPGIFIADDVTNNDAQPTQFSFGLQNFLYYVG